MERLQNWQERWDRIRQFRDEGRTYQEIGKVLGLDSRYVWKLANSRRPQDKRRRTDIPAMPQFDIQHRHKALAVGALGELMVLIALIRRGFDVWRPAIDGHRADFAISKGNALVRIQVKTAEENRAKRSYRLSVTRKRRNKPRQSYDPKEVDFFLVCCLGAEAIYVIPADVAIACGYLNLYPHRERLLTRDPVGFDQYKDAFGLLTQRLDMA
jgi:hypothetical protein